MRTGRTNKMTQNRFPVQKSMLESWNKPWWITYHAEKLNKIQENRAGTQRPVQSFVLIVKAILPQTVIGYIFHM